MSRKRFPVEFKRECVALIRSGRSVASVSKECGVSEQSLHRWKAEFVGGVSREESLEIKRLKRENRRLREDADILKKAIVFFTNDSV